MIWTDSFGEGTTLNKQKRADLLLVMVTFFWGASYYLTNLCLTDLQPMNLNAFRFLSAFAVLGVVFRKRLRRISRVTLCYTLLVGLALTGTYVAYGYGVSRTSVSNAAFICALPVVVTPIFDFFFCHKKPGRRLLFSLAICTAGLALMTLNDGLRPASGDLICLIVPVCYAVDLLLTERAVRAPAGRSADARRVPTGRRRRADAGDVAADRAAPSADDGRDVGGSAVSGAALLGGRLRRPDRAAAVHDRRAMWG